jgi:hypothetical protein
MLQCVHRASEALLLGLIRSQSEFSKVLQIGLQTMKAKEQTEKENSKRAVTASAAAPEAAPVAEEIKQTADGSGETKAAGDATSDAAAKPDATVVQPVEKGEAGVEKLKSDTKTFSVMSLADRVETLRGQAQTHRPNPCRLALKSTVDSWSFKLFIALCVLLNTVVLSLEYQGMSSSFRDALQISNYVLTLVFLAEMVGCQCGQLVV